MRAVVQDRYGPPEALRVTDIPVPVPGPGEVLVRVRAAALNAYDWHVVRGDPYLARLSTGLRAAAANVRGRDFAGVVEAVGSAVTRLRSGDEVYGEAHGAFAEYVCADQSVVETKPANLSFEQAAAIPLAANTALIGVRDLARAHPGQRLLVNGASGGVGTFAVQLAHAYGAHVTGVCRTGNIDLVRAAGADDVIDYTREDFTRQGRRYDVILDLVGNRTLAAYRRALQPRGTLILSGGGVYRGGSLLGPIGLMLRSALVKRFVRQRLVFLTAVPGAANLAALREFAESGRLVPVIDRTYPLEQTPRALAYLETEHARAKVVITV